VLDATRFDELKASNQLPSPTGVALAILRLGEAETTTPQEIAQILQTDPALSGRVLKIANSAYCGRTRPIGSVREAVTHLGIRLVRNVALGFSLVSQCGRGACRGFDYGGFWSRSLAMGVAAQEVAGYVGQIAPAEAFTCGLLAQVGRLGGEEFVVIGPCMDVTAATRCAERLRLAVEAQTIETPSASVKVTLSIGVAVRTEHMENPAELLKAADLAVYAAKDGGRNQVRTAPAEPEPCASCLPSPQRGERVRA
jgi:hypothetical protein